jgi:hypothetical protein
MYICKKCADAHKLETRHPTSSNGVCEICFKPENLAWTDQLMRTFPGDGLPTTEEQLKTRKTQARRAERRHDRALILAIETLALYANPESYHAIAMIYERPCGWFEGDVSKTDHPHYAREMHGDAARKALAKIQKLVTPNAPGQRPGDTKI